MHQVINMCVPAKRIPAGNGVVVKSREVADGKTGVLSPRLEFPGFDEAVVAVGAFFNQAEKIFSADDCEKKGLQVSVQGGEEYISTGLYQKSASPDHALRMGNMFQKLHANYRVE